MRRITIDQEKELKYLYKLEWSAPSIAEKLSLSLNQIYDSLQRQGIKRRNATLQNFIRFKRMPLSYNFKKDFLRKEKDLLIAAVMLYFAEGTKTGNTIDFANSNPDVIELFIKFLREICGVKEEKIKIYLYCFSDQNIQELISFWARRLKINYNQFTKPYIRPFRENSKRRMQWGVVHIRYADKRLLEKILFIYSKLINKMLH